LKKLDEGIEPKRFDYIKRPESKRLNIGRVSWEENYERLDDWTKNRIRYHNKDTLLYDVGTPDRNIGYSLYRESLIHAGKEYLIHRYNLDSIAGDVIKCKKLSEFIKKRGEKETEDWRYLVDLQRLGDFLPYKEESDFVEDIKDWVQRKPKHSWNGSEDEWYKRFEDTLKMLLLRNGKRPDKVMTIDEFVRNGDIWCTSGSGFEPESEKLKVTDKYRDKIFDVKKNKWSVRWSLSNYKVKRLMYKKRKQICKAVQKSEPGKVRAVISSDLALYLKMSYVSQFLEKSLAGSKLSTLWMSKDDRFDLWQSMGYDGTWRMPLDQSEFDKNVSIRQIKIILKVIRWYLEYMNASDEILDMMDLIIYGLDGGYVLIGGHRIEIMNGVLSGWRWTALFDTLVNLVEVFMAKDWVEENSNIRVDFLGLNAQGDDDWFKFRTRKEAIAMWLAYESFGLDVNPGKFFLSKHRDEYLRRVMDKDVITGYPARSITSICFRSPIREKESLGGDRVRQGLNKWKLFCERMGAVFYRSWWMRSWYKDSVQGVKGFTKKMIDEWMNTNVVAGGIGYDGFESEDGFVPSSSLQKHNYLEINGDGFKEWVKFAENYSVDERTCNYFAVSTLDISDKTLADWVKYIYTFDNLGQQPVEYGLKTDQRGTICIGKQAYSYARTHNLRWYPSLQRAKHSTYFEDWDWEKARYIKKVKHINIPLLKRSWRPEVVDGITVTLANLSNDYDKVYTNYDPKIFEHKPKSWVEDLFKGRLKAPGSPRPGWGTDTIGHIAQKLLHGAITIFLSMNRPHLHLWDSILVSLNATIPKVLETLKVRVVE
jgi:hypothetical protein